MIRTVLIIALTIFTTSAWAAKKPCARLLVSDDFIEMVNEEARTVAEWAGDFKLKSDLGAPLKGDAEQIAKWISQLKNRIARIRADYYVSSDLAEKGLKKLKNQIARLGPQLDDSLQLAAEKPMAAPTGPKRFMKREVLDALPETEGMSGPEVEAYLRGENQSAPPPAPPGFYEWPPRMKP